MTSLNENISKEDAKRLQRMKSANPAQAKRLQAEDQRFALIAACADGGLGHACILEKYDG